MNNYEKDAAARLPSEFRPLGAWGYFGYSLLFSIPLIGFIALIICACSGSNINRRSFARSYFCGFLICVIIIVLMLVFAGSFLSGIIEQLQGLFNK